MDAAYARYLFDLANPSDESLIRLGRLVLKLRDTPFALRYAGGDWIVTKDTTVGALWGGPFDTPTEALSEAFDALERAEGNR